MNLREEIDRLIAHAAQVKMNVKSAIGELPDNPRIERLGSGFIIPSADLSENLSPFYHDFKAQHAQLQQLVDDVSVEQLGRVLSRVVETGKTGRTGDQGLVFHPEVRKALDQALFSVAESGGGGR